MDAAVLLSSKKEIRKQKTAYGVVFFGFPFLFPKEREMSDYDRKYAAVLLSSKKEIRKQKTAYGVVFFGFPFLFSKREGNE